MRKLRKILPHFCIIMGLVFMTLLIIDQMNDAMGFITDQITKVMMMVSWPLVILSSALYAYDQRKAQRIKEQQAAQRRREARRAKLQKPE